MTYSKYSLVGCTIAVLFISGLDILKHPSLNAVVEFVALVSPVQQWHVFHLLLHDVQGKCAVNEEKK